MSEHNKKVAVDFIEAFSRGDAAAAEACLDPTALMIAKGFGKLSGQRTYEFIVATTGAFKSVIPTGLRPKILNVIAEGNKVAVEFEGNAELANGKDYCNQYCMVFTLANGKITLGHEYYCTLLADDRLLPVLAEVEEKRQKALA
jgi:ketosteroid isomerase-like protein